VKDLESRPVAAAPAASKPAAAPAPKPDKPTPPPAPVGPTPEEKAALEAKVKAAIADLASGDINKIFPACDVLGKAGDLSAVEPLIKVLKESKDTYARTAAAAALGALHACDAMPALLAAFLDKDDGVVIQAGVAVRKITDQDSGLNANPTRKERTDAKDRLTKWWRDHEAEMREKWKQPKASDEPAPAPGSEAPGAPGGDPK
jgi:HEAT repeat protein